MARSDLTADDQRLLGAFSRPIEPCRSTPLYRVSLMLVAVVMVALPLAYIALIGVAGYGVWWWATHVGWPSGRGRGSLMGGLLVYVGPLVIGSIAVLFMLKPLFAPRGRSAPPIELDPAREPLLFAFVQKLCRTVGAPMPKRIEVTCEVNAAAGMRRGWLSLFGSDLRLIIGLPLVATLDLRQFTGVLAHEFGHFAQGAAMRANFVVRSVNHWFARVVYQRDAMDEWLVRAASGAGEVHWAAALVLHLARAMVWLTRQVLRVFMVAGHLVSSLLSRQMEFDADRHACRVVGSAAFAAALRELPVIVTAERGAMHDLGEAWREKRLGDDLPALIRANIPQIAADARERIIADGMSGNASMYDSHPATRDRIARGEAEPEAGVFAAEGPADAVFRDFARLSRATTLAWYRDSAGLEVQAGALVPTQALVAQAERRVAGGKAQERWFAGLWRGGLLFAPPEAVAEALDAAALQDAVAALPAAENEAREAHTVLEQLDEAADQAACAVALIDAGLPIDAAAFALPRDTKAAAEASLTKARTQRAAQRDRCAAAADGQRRRLALALAGAAGADGERIARLLACLAALAAHQDSIDRLREDLAALGMLAQNLEGRQEDATFIAAIRRVMSRLRLQLERLRGAWAKAPWPNEVGDEQRTVATRLIARVPTADDLGGIAGATQEALRGAFGLHARILGELAQLAQSAEERVSARAAAV